MATKRKSVSSYLPNNLGKRLEQYAARTKNTQSAVVQLALDQFLNEEDSETFSKIMIFKFNNMQKQLDNLETKIEIIGEALDLFVNYFFLYSPDLGDETAEQKKQMSDKVKVKHSNYLEKLKKRLQKEGRLNELIRSSLED